jgi:Ca2+-binding EF-hand superfamily protein
MAPALGGGSAGGRAGGAAPSEMESHAEALFRTVDRDGSGLISFDEFQSWWTRRTIAMSDGRQMDSGLMDEAKAKWDELDSDGSGDLDTSEFEKLM